MMFYTNVVRDVPPNSKLDSSQSYSSTGTTENVPDRTQTSEYNSQAPTRTSSPVARRDRAYDWALKRECSHCGNPVVTDEEERRRKEEGFDEEKKDPNLVDWDGKDDPAKPMNFPRRKKWIITMMTSATTFCVSFGSSVFSTTVQVTAEQFQTSETTMVLGVSLYVLGLALGPLIFGPASEYVGRKLPLFLGVFVFAIFQIPVAVAQNLETIFLCRFLAGAFGSAPIGINSAMFADFWDPIDRGVATSIYATVLFTGPVAGPIVGSFITQSYLGWRWTAWITLIMTAALAIPGYLLVPETFEPVLLKRKAQKMRLETQNWALHAKIEEQPFQIQTFLRKYLNKPFKMFFSEPILMVITLYLAITYALLYLLFFAYPYSFEMRRGWSPTLASLPFIGLLIGLVTGGLGLTTYTKVYYQPRLRRRKKVLAEDRLPPMILGGVLLPIGLFWFAWTSFPQITWIPQALAGIPIGIGIMLIFMPGLTYIVDLYLTNASSAVSANSFFRAVVAAGLPVAAPTMYATLDTPWATTILALVLTALIPAPVIFYVFGEKVRSWSKYQPNK